MILLLDFSKNLYNIGKFIWEYENWDDYSDDIITCKKDPKQWVVVDDIGNAHRFEQEFQIALFGILSNLKRLDEMVYIVY